MYKLSEYLRGWYGYYGLAELPSVYRDLDKWIRRRLRMLHLKQWRKPRTRFQEFARLGMSTNDCWFLIRTTKRYWYLSGTSAVNRALNNKYFQELGLFCLAERAELKAS
ncbi:MAG: group II intron maturase-specific domain-containing protein [Oligoflexus sp.]